ncbi:HAD family hydrolase [Altericroceibacterium xinjiangense]|uniref:HAD family hydrolase n=1 Tax=Altericroceibacterium xinjiangense TaxID=762261 RepID=UPI0013E02077|nr:HAD family hydrolase [Altericroceibacterium xinjiangense]
MTIKAVFFDIDGTLVDSNDYHVTAWEEAFARSGSTVARHEIHGQIGKGADMLIPALLPDADDETRHQLAQAHGTIFKSAFLERVEPFPSARDLLLRTQESGLQVVLASSASQGELDHYLQLLDAQSIVTATTCADDVEHTKPDPDIFASALSKLPGVEASEVIVIGDTPYDIEAARRCGMAAVGLRSGKFPDQSLWEANPVALYDDVAAILADFANSPISQPWKT